MFRVGISHIHRYDRYLYDNFCVKSYLEENEHNNFNKLLIV